MSELHTLPAIAVLNDGCAAREPAAASPVQ